MLLEMGFELLYIKKALTITQDLEQAINIIVELKDQGLEDFEMEEELPLIEQHKMVIVARKDLKMGAGKLAAQVGHGVLAAYKKSVKNSPENIEKWEMFGQAKVVVRANSEKEL